MKSTPRLEREIREEIDGLKGIVELQNITIRDLEAKLKETRTLTFTSARAISDALTVGQITVQYESEA